MHLTEDYRIIDEQAGQPWDDSLKRLQPMTPQEIQALRRWSVEQMDQRVVRFATLDWSAQGLLDSTLPGCGARLAPVIGLGMTQDRNHAAQVANSHGFSIEWLCIPPGGQVSRHRLQEKQVLIVYRGNVAIDVQGADTVVRTQAGGSPAGWDSFAMPQDCWRSYHNQGSDDAVVLVMTPGDGRKFITWSPEVTAAAADQNRAIDANGFVAPKNFVDRSQR